MGRSRSSVRGPIPGTRVSSSMLPNGRCAAIRPANAGPMRGKSWRSASLAVLTFIGWPSRSARAPADNRGATVLAKSAGAGATSRERANEESAINATISASAWIGALRTVSIPAHRSPRTPVARGSSGSAEETVVQDANGQLGVLAADQARGLDLAGADRLDVDAFVGEQPEHLGRNTGVRAHAEPHD